MQNKTHQKTAKNYEEDVKKELVHPLKSATKIRVSESKINSARIKYETILKMLIRTSGITLFFGILQALFRSKSMQREFAI